MGALTELGTVPSLLRGATARPPGRPPAASCWEFSVPDEVGHFFEAARGGQVRDRVPAVQERTGPFVHYRDSDVSADYPGEARLTSVARSAHISPN